MDQIRVAGLTYEEIGVWSGRVFGIDRSLLVAPEEQPGFGLVRLL